MEPILLALILLASVATASLVIVLLAKMPRNLRRLSPTFAILHSSTGRPSIPPERLLRALLLCR